MKRHDDEERRNGEVIVSWARARRSHGLAGQVRWYKASLTKGREEIPRLEAGKDRPVRHYTSHLVPTVAFQLRYYNR